jgi:hypothetical protein
LSPILMTIPSVRFSDPVSEAPSRPDFSAFAGIWGD